MYVLQWLHGLKRLGHQVIFLEFLKKDPGPAAGCYFHDTIGAWWDPRAAALMLAQSGRSLAGLQSEEVVRIVREAEAVITIAAPYRRDPYPFLEQIRPRILIDQDPAYTHLWAIGSDPAEIFGEHEFYFTVGAKVGSPGCDLPTLGIRWRPIWNPVVLDWWTTRPVTRDRFTTVADWRSYGYLEFNGQVLGPKAEEFRKFIDLPGLAGDTLEIALQIDLDDPDLADLRRHGWHIENPGVVSSPDDYRAYVESSRGEFSCAKGGYVGTGCGWFSDRSVCYLAAGRPVILQATGFENLLPTGQGLFAVRTVEEAAEAVRAVRRDYAFHSTAARAIAQEHFDSDRLLRRLLAEAGIRSSEPCPNPCW
jgi:hypothetical protein